MSNNAAVTADGGEIGRAQALQARACGVEPSVHMNPVLLKPQSEVGAQVVVQGRILGNAQAADYHRLKPTLLPKVLESFDRLRGEADLVLVEGAGSPAEVNLRAGDIANMGFAAAARVPVLLIGDIDRGGVIASLVGTHALLEPEERALLRGFIVNKFRGDLRLFDGGLAIIRDAHGTAEPRGRALLRGRPPPAGGRRRRPVVVRDAGGRRGDPHRRAPAAAHRQFRRSRPAAAGARCRASIWCRPAARCPRPISSCCRARNRPSPISAFLREQGWHIDIAAHVRRGGRVLGLCGGYQMLGRRIADPGGIEGPAGAVDGLALLDVETELTGDKTLVEVHGEDVAGDARRAATRCMSASPTARRPRVRCCG